MAPLPGAAGRAWAKGPKRAHIVSFDGYGTTEAVILRGRALKGKPSSGARGHGSARKFFSTAHAFLRRDLEHVEIAVSDERQQVLARAQTDDEGFFEANVPGPFPVGPRRFFVALGAGKYASDPLAVDVLLVAPAQPGWVVITDIDDTVVVTHAHQNKASLVWAQARGNVDDMQPIPGAAAVLSRFFRAGVPVVYVSAGPVELAPRARAFLQENGFPAGALFFRHYEDDGIGAPVAYKLDRIRKVMSAFPQRRFILIGDNGETDPEIFVRLVQAGAPVARAYVRRELAGARGQDPRLTFFSDWQELLRDAKNRRFLP